MKAYFVRHDGPDRGTVPEGGVSPEVIVFDPALVNFASDIRSRVGTALVGDEMWGTTERNDSSLEDFLKNELERLSRTYSGKTILVVTHQMILQCLAERFDGRGTGEKGDPMLVEIHDRPETSAITRSKETIL